MPWIEKIKKPVPLKTIKEKDLKDRIKPNSLIHGDCLNVMPYIPDESVDLILCDPPYGKTACAWDSIIPIDLMWEQIKRIIKPKGVIALTAIQPFTSMLVVSNLKMFKFDYVWNKKRGSNFLNMKREPSKEHETMLIFYNSAPTYNPIKIKRSSNRTKRTYGKRKNNSSVYGGGIKRAVYSPTELRMPSSILTFVTDSNNQFKKKRFHPTQKPIRLFEYLIATFTNKNDTVLDFAAGGGTTALACDNLQRQWICIEKEQEYFEVSEKRIKENKAKPYKQRLQKLKDGVVLLD